MTQNQQKNKRISNTVSTKDHSNCQKTGKKNLLNPLPLAHEGLLHLQNQLTTNNAEF